MNIPQFSIDRSVTTIMLMAAIVFMGIIALTSLPQELFPKISFPQITVVSNYVNAAPEEIETLITRPLEEAISSTSGLRRLESMSQEGVSTIFATFGWNENVDFAALAVREKIDLVKERLPKESEDPIVLKFDPIARPIMILSITGNMSPADLKLLSERILKENLEKVEGVASATISGGLDSEIQVELDQGGLQTSSVSILDVIDSIDSANISYPAGSIKKGLYEYLIRTVGEFRSVGEIGYTVISTDVKEEVHREASSFVEKIAEETRQTTDTLREKQKRAIGEKRLILVKDIGEVRDSFREKSSISRYNGKENIALAIQKQGSANAVEVARRVRRELAFLREELELRGLQVEIAYDHSKFIKQAIANVRDAAVFGGIIAAIILYLFFRNAFTAFIVAIAIPICVIGTFFLCQLQGITINMMSLGGLALGSGMIVDNSIVVIENIFRLRETGMDADEASEKGANEVFWPVFSSTLTTVAVFLPIILFVPGVAGQLFRDLSWTVIYSLALSLFVSITLVPMLATYIELAEHAGKKAVSLSGRFLENVKSFFSNKNEKEQTRFFLRIVGAGVGLFVLSIFILRSLDTEVIPKVDQGQFLIRIDLPVGSRLEATDEMVQIIEREAREIPEVKDVSVTVGSATAAKSGQVTIETLRPYQALVLVTLQDKRKRSSNAV